MKPSLPSILARTIQRHGLLPAGCHAVLGVSGGADSVALLYALHRLQPRFDFALTVAHLHHGLRGKEADRDAEFVQELARKLGLPFVLQRVDVSAAARDQRCSVEMAGREARYAFLFRVARQVGADRVVTAHHADDQAETLLLRLLRGASPAGLGGMDFQSTWPDGLLIRPMLEVDHAQALAFLRAHRLRWREDASNNDTAILRNRVRHVVMPFLQKQFGAPVRDALVRTSAILRDEQAWIEGLVEASGRVVLARDGGLREGPWRRLPLALQRRLAVRWLREQGVDPARIDFALIERVTEWIGGETSRLSLPGRQLLERSGGIIRFQKASRSTPSHDVVEMLVPSKAAGTNASWTLTTKSGLGFRREPARRPGPGLFKAQLSEARRAGAPLLVRTRRPGDRMRPWGLTGTVKLQDVLVDLKVPAAWRDRIPVVLCRGEIVWLPGYRIARDWAVRGPLDPSVHLALRIHG